MKIRFFFDYFCMYLPAQRRLLTELVGTAQPIQAVVDVYVKSVTAKHPKTRYPKRLKKTEFFVKVSCGLFFFLEV